MSEDVIISSEWIEDRREEVKRMAQIGNTNKDIAYILEIDEGTVKRCYSQELNWGRAHLRSALRKAQLETAIVHKNSSMLIWLGKNYLDQKEPRHQVDHSGGITVEKIVFDDPKEITVQS